jgi:hypothetical protein
VNPLDLPALSKINNSLEISDSPLLPSISLPDMIEIGQDLAIQWNPKIQFPVLKSAGSILVANDAI